MSHFDRYGRATHYALISRCRDSADTLRRTLGSVIAQTMPPARWVIVDDGSKDGSLPILREYAARHSWIKVLRKRGSAFRPEGAGVVEAFNEGLRAIELDEYAFIGSVGLDLDLPPRYFEGLIRRLTADPRLGSASGRPYAARGGTFVSDRRTGATVGSTPKLYRVECFREIGGLVPGAVRGGIDCHKARQLGWIVRSWDAPDLNFVRVGHAGARGPVDALRDVFSAIGNRSPEVDDAELRAFIRRYERRAFLVGRRKAIEEIEAEREPLWRKRHGMPVAV